MTVVCHAYHEDCDRECPDGQFISDTCGTDVRQGDVCCCKGNFFYFYALKFVLTQRVITYVHITKALRAAQHASKLISSLLNFSRCNAGFGYCLYISSSVCLAQMYFIK